MPDAADQRRKYLALLAEKFPTAQSVFTEIINLEAILNLPKGTEHFVSDVHGECEAFEHILNNCSGVIRERVQSAFRLELTREEQAELCTLIYYPGRKLRRLHEAGAASDEWYAITLMRLVRLARHLASSYTRSKVRKAMPVAYAYIIDELLHSSPEEADRRQGYHQRIIETVLDTGSADDFIRSLSALIKRLAVDHLHVVGDVYDRGPHADRIVDRLMRYHSVDLQWGNHDIVWMGAAAGSAACLAAVIRNNIHYDTLEILESAYGVSLRELALFAESAYRADDAMAPMEKAISVIMFKLEGQTILRHPAWHMGDRLLLEHVDARRGVARVGGRDYELRTTDFPTLLPDDPYRLTEGEARVMESLMAAVRASEKLRAHVNFLYERGGAYLVRNDNVLFHACVPMDEEGAFRPVTHQGRPLAGRAYYDYADRLARRAWVEGDQVSLDWMWYLWCGRFSPLSGRVVKTFERTYFTDRSTWEEPRDPYFRLMADERVCRRVLEEFGCDPERGHVINGHTPVHAGAGERPVRAGGRLLIIDGGFCRAYHGTTGIAGYTLIADPRGMRIKAHRPFASIADVLDLNADIMSDDDRFELEPVPLTVGDTDTGADIRSQIADLRALLDAYRRGELAERADA
ncbi:fructose-1,6-bisphosphatase [Thermophilibacter sp.]